MKKATFVRDISENFTGEARLYAVEDRTGFVIVSSTTGGALGAMLFGAIDETMVFEAEESGRPTDWMDIGVAYPSGQWDAALASAGYEVEA
jgi:hypothetical protein